MKTVILALFSIAALSADSFGADEKDVLAAREAYRNAYLRGDEVQINKLLSADLTYVHSEGLVQNKTEMIHSVVAGPRPPKIAFLPDAVVRIHGRTAFVTGHEDFWDSRVIKHLHVLQVWEKTSQGWQMVARQATLITTQTRSE
jgi:hypothetical protein